jgi:hypothetical protein
MLGTLGGSLETLEGSRILKEALDVSSRVPVHPGGSTIVTEFPWYSMFSTRF